ncbi:MAG: peptidase inhibitor, partial [Leptospiraceae bacterium]|nr:peptidase inhibitor [Leptospiraceae bacterium]
RFNLKPDFKSISGKKVNGKTQFQFSTGGPSVIRSTPYEGADIEEDQIIIVKTDTEINPLSFAGNVHFAIEGIKSKVEAILLSDNSDEVKEIIKNKYNGKKQNNTYFIKSKLVFPNHKKVELIWDIGVSSKTGVSNQDRQVLTYQVRAPFAVTFSCERENPNAACIPFMNMFLNFNSNFTQDQLSKIYMEGGGKTYKPKVNSSDLASGTSINYIEFEGPFPENEKFKITIEKGLQDEAGRNLENQNKYPMAVSTAEFPPLVKFSGRFGIIESEGDATLPVTVRNLEPKIKSRILKMKPELDADLKKISGKKKKISPSEVLYWLRRISATNRTQSIFSFKKMGEDFDFKKPNGPKPFEVVGIPLKEKGFYAVELESSNLGKSLLLSGGNMFVPTLALVTNMSVHFKHGKENSLVWVTSLNDGKPVENVKISILNCENKVLYEGKTNSSGLTIIDKSIKNKYCSYQKYSNGLIVFAEKGDDFSFVHSGWNKGIENWRFNLPYGEIHNRYIYHTILDRPLFRAGETVSMKHLGRIHKMEGFNYTSKSMNPDNIKIVHDGSGKEFSFSLDWKKSNAATSVWKIPKEAKLGEYSIYLVNKKSHIYQKTASFRVEEFRVPLLKGTIQVPSSKLVQNKEVKIGAQVQYLAGGPASNLPVKFKYWFRDSYYESVSDYDDYSFNSKSIKEGKFSTQNYNNYEYGDDEGNTEPNTNNNIQKKEASLDKLGTAGFKIENIPESEKTQVLAMEMDYRDPNGEIQTIFDSVKIYPSKFKIGIKQDGWISDKDNVKISTIVLDLNNKPVKGKEVSLTIYSKKYLSHRKRLVGGFYSYDSFEEIEKVGNFCSGKTDELGMLTCENPSPVKGTILLEARIEGENVNSYSELYISGDDEYRYYSVSDNDRMDVLPEKKMYEPGDTARFQVKMPFSKATALVTVEREGVIDNYIKELSGKSPVVEIPIKGNYGPNVFVSV